MKRKIYKDFKGWWDCRCCQKILVNRQKTRQQNSLVDQLEELDNGELQKEEFKANQNGD